MDRVNEELLSFKGIKRNQVGSKLNDIQEQYKLSQGWSVRIPTVIYHNDNELVDLEVLVYQSNSQFDNKTINFVDLSVDKDSKDFILDQINQLYNADDEWTIGKVIDIDNGDNNTVTLIVSMTKNVKVKSLK